MTPAKYKKNPLILARNLGLIALKFGTGYFIVVCLAALISLSDPTPAGDDLVEKLSAYGWFFIALLLMLYLGISACTWSINKTPAKS